MDHSVLMQNSSTFPLNSPVLSAPRFPPLRVIREAHGWSVRDVAERAGVDPGHLSKIERGLAGVSVETLASIATVLGLTELATLLAPYIRETP